MAGKLTNAMPLTMAPVPITPIVCRDVIVSPSKVSISFSRGLEVRSRISSSHDVHAAVDVLRCTRQPSCIGRGKECAGEADVHDVDQLANRRALRGIRQEQIKVLE